MVEREKFSQWLADQLHQHGWTRAEFARLAGMSAPQVTRLLKGEQRPGPASLRKIAHICDVKEESLYKLAGYITVKVSRESQEAVALYDKILELPTAIREQAAEYINYLHERYHPENKKE